MLRIKAQAFAVKSYQEHAMGLQKYGYAIYMIQWKNRRDFMSSSICPGTKGNRFCQNETFPSVDCGKQFVAAYDTIWTSKY